MLTKKEKKEVALIFASVLIVAIAGMLLTQTPSSTSTGLASAKYVAQCQPVFGIGNCNSLCGQRMCLPLQENCDVFKSDNSCSCCPQNSVLNFERASVIKKTGTCNNLCAQENKVCILAEGGKKTCSQLDSSYCTCI